MTTDRTERSEIDYETTRSIGKGFLATLALLSLLSLVWLLPGIDRLIPGTPVTFVAIAGAIVTLAIVALLVYLAPAFATLVRSMLDGPQPVVEDVASIVQLLVVFVAILVAHRGLAPVLVPFLDGVAWMYDVVFFALAFPPLAILAVRVYTSLDPMADVLAERVAETSNDE